MSLVSTIDRPTAPPPVPEPRGEVSSGKQFWGSEITLAADPAGSFPPLIQHVLRCRRCEGSGRMRFLRGCCIRFEPACCPECNGAGVCAMFAPVLVPEDSERNPPEPERFAAGLLTVSAQHC
eukprot:NODE_13797_length_1146_cov_7.515211.p3 GENE.NODE_13797_length_1146_cov_7.515211~~NODE_13797_length_1146_cov_7.515211.p3  ORF type:complete len:122 (-),score=22.72 NODE_13797_length_1146_cov_7.515211:688-1053(-)